MEKTKFANTNEIILNEGAGPYFFCISLCCASHEFFRVRDICVKTLKLQLFAGAINKFSMIFSIEERGGRVQIRGSWGRQREIIVQSSSRKKIHVD